MWNDDCFFFCMYELELLSDKSHYKRAKLRNNYAMPRKEKTVLTEILLGMYQLMEKSAGKLVSQFSKRSLMPLRQKQEILQNKTQGITPDSWWRRTDM